jgi:hypothetical protein
MTSVKMWKPPPRREYRPKPMDPGQPVTWTARTAGYWTGPPQHSGDGEPYWYKPGTEWHEPTRSQWAGVIWSDGPAAGTWWVCPDDDPQHPVVVRRHGRKFSSEWREGELHEEHGWPGQDGIRRAEAVRRHGSVYATVRQRDPGSHDYFSRSRRPDRVFLIWHADPDCPRAAAYERWDGEGYSYSGHHTVDSMVDVLAGRVPAYSEPPFCGGCVMLDRAAEPAPAMALAA